jgi:hypothetical protein
MLAEKTPDADEMTSFVRHVGAIVGEMFDGVARRRCYLPVSLELKGKGWGRLHLINHDNTVM